MKPIVTNAASEKQVREAKIKEKIVQTTEAGDLRAMMSMKEGRRFLRKMLDECHVFASICHSSGSMTYYNSGKQDVGHWLVDQITRADQRLYLLMLTEAMEGKYK